MAGMHGDEINGMEIIRRVIHKGWYKPSKGTVICIPIFNIFGFLNVSRELPDGRDLNRSFPGSKNGSLASQFAYHFMKEIAPITDYILVFCLVMDLQYKIKVIRQQVYIEILLD